MTVPVSVGDVVLLAKLAFRIGQAFTKGRKAAPAEFREVESQLYSLSEALYALKEARESDDSSPPLFASSNSSTSAAAHHHDRHGHQDVILDMLSSCRSTLSHLESIVDKYGVLKKPVDPQLPRFKRWNEELRANWKKIAWTAEGSDLAGLRSNLVIHTNSLSLILGVVVNRQACHIQNDIDHISMMLTDIHKWFVDNLKDTMTLAPFPAHMMSMDDQKSSSTQLHFELHEQAGDTLKQICPRASLVQSAFGAQSESSVKNHHIFICRCAHTGTDPSNHRQSVNAYELSPLSFATRIIGVNRSWLIYKITNKSTHQLVSLQISGVPPEIMYDFEEFLMHNLCIVQARSMLRRRMSTMLTYVSSSATQPAKANILDMIGNITPISQSIVAVKFASGAREYLRDSIKFIQILHYKSIDLQRILDDSALPLEVFEHDRRAEILIVYGEDGHGTHADDVIRSTILLKLSTTIQQSHNDDSVALQDISCTSFHANGRSSATSSLAAIFQFSERQASDAFYKLMEAIRMELFIIHLQCPRDDEKILFRVQAQDVCTDRMSIPYAEITILQDTVTERFRLVLKSRHGYSMLSQELAEDFFQRLATEGRPNYGSLTYEVFIDATGRRRVRQNPDGLHHLEFSDIKS